MKHKARNFNQQQWDRLVLYLFMIIQRVRNRHNFSWYALINGASTWSSQTGNMDVHLGLCLTRVSILRKLHLKYNRAEVERMIIERLKKELICIGSFDNTQLFQLLKFQREGHSSNADIITSLLFLLANIPKDHDIVIYPDSDVPVTYDKQMIPAPMGMPDYHKEPTMCGASFLIDNSYGFNPNPDMSGASVEEYAKRIWFASKVYSQHRYFGKLSEGTRHHYQSDESHDAMIRLNLFEKFEACRTRNRYGPSAFYSQAFTYQNRETRIWRGEVKKASVIIPPLSAQNETTNLGAAKVVLSMLRLCGLLEPTEVGPTIPSSTLASPSSSTSASAASSSTSVSPSTSTSVSASSSANASPSSSTSASTSASSNPSELLGMTLGKDWNKRHLILFGDGLSQVRARSFDNLIRDSSNHFGPQQSMRTILKKALSRVVHVTGDLHGGNFHFLSAVYTMFYGCLLQPIQTMLGWKRIKGSDVTKCYQLAALLALTVAEVVEKELFGTFFQELLLIQKEVDRLNRIKDPADYCVEITRLFDVWCEKKRGTTTDERLLMLLNYIKAMHYYRLFRVSVGNGDAVMIEWLYKEFLPIYLVNGKYNYFEIVLGMIETFYGALSKSSDLLHVIRVNRTMPLYEGKDKYNNPMSNWAQDAILENLQKLFHSIPFEQSQHVLTMEKSKRFCKKEYTWASTAQGRKAKKDGKDDSPFNDRGNDMKKTTVPKREKEVIAVSEFISKLDIGKEIPNRKYVRNEIIHILSTIESELIDPVAEEKRKKREREMMTEEDFVVSSMVNEIFDAEKNKKSGVAAKECDSDDDLVDDDDSLANGNSDVESDSDLDAASMEGIAHEDDDIMLEEDDAFLLSDDESVDLAEIGTMDITLDPLDESEKTKSPFTPEEEEELKGEDQMRVDYDERTMEIVVGKGSHKKSIRLAKVNSLAFKDLFRFAREKLSKLNLSETRFAANERKEREQKLTVEVLESITGVPGSDENDMTKEGFAKFGF